MCISVEYISKSLGRRFFSFTTFLAIFFIFSSIASANYFNNTRKGNGFHYAWYDPSVAQYGYTTHFNDGRNYWNQSPEIGIGLSNTYKKWDDKYIIANSSVAGLYGQIYVAKYVIDSSGTYATYGQDEWKDDYWDFCNVIMYDNTMKFTENWTRSYVSYNAVHEIGHSIMMAHESLSNDSVMRQGWRVIPGGSGNIKITDYDKTDVYNKWKNY